MLAAPELAEGGEEPSMPAVEAVLEAALAAGAGSDEAVAEARSSRCFPSTTSTTSSSTATSSSITTSTSTSTSSTTTTTPPPHPPGAGGTAAT